MHMRAYVRGLAAELDAVKERALVCDGSCRSTKAAMASTIKEYIAGSLEDKQQLADCTKALLDKDRTIQTTLATLQTANEDNDKLREQLRELRQQLQQVEEEKS
jgi:septal ring factor EnvC (AmiA/AmiB activator)